MNIQKDIPWIHSVRVLACVMVVMLHSLPPIYEFECEGVDLSFLMMVSAFTRPCVPLFFMITGYLILPYKQDDAFSFYKKRIPRVYFPLLIWSIVYAILPYLLGMYGSQVMMKELLFSLIKMPGRIGALLWYIFILIGIYLFIPFITKEIYYNRKIIASYLCLWFVSSLVFVLKYYEKELLGQCLLHQFDMLIYFSGYFGYLLLGYYIKRWGFPMPKSICPVGGAK